MAKVQSTRRAKPEEPRFPELVAQLKAESHRGAVLIVTTFVNNAVGGLLRARLVKGTADVVLGPKRGFYEDQYQPEGMAPTLRDRVELAFALGLLTKEERAALRGFAAIQDACLRFDGEFRIEHGTNKVFDVLKTPPFSTVHKISRKLVAMTPEAPRGAAWRHTYVLTGMALAGFLGARKDRVACLDVPQFSKAEAKDRASQLQLVALVYGGGLKKLIPIIEEAVKQFAEAASSLLTPRKSKDSE
jgi:hypothetical protein